LGFCFVDSFRDPIFILIVLEMVQKRDKTEKKIIAPVAGVV
jgi:hypothetical protein